MVEVRTGNFMGDFMTICDRRHATPWAGGARPAEGACLSPHSPLQGLELGQGLAGRVHSGQHLWAGGLGLGAGLRP